MANLEIGLILLASCIIVSSKRYCRQDADCDVIGDLTCQKSVCDEWGVCGCPRGQASRFVGSSLKFQCVTLKKIGESCSTDGTDGLCGPANSKCAEGKCACEGTSISIWDGERCSTTVGSSANSETCSKAIGSLGICGFDIGTGIYPSTCITSNENWWDPLYDRSPFDGVPNTCACGEGRHTLIPNDYDTSAFVGRRVPRCVNIIVGDTCLHDADCSWIGNAICNSDFKCACNAGFSPYNEGKNCKATGTLLAKGDTCRDSTGGLGDCGMNMVCGDVCKIKDFVNNNKDRLCVCAPGFNENGNDCVAISSGSSCSGDGMCKVLGYDALCLDGVCRAGASTAVNSFTILLISLYVTISLT